MVTSNVLSVPGHGVQLPDSPHTLLSAVLLFDDYEPLLSEGPMEDFNKFLATPWTLQGSEGPSRGKFMQMATARFDLLLRSRSWTSPDERLLRNSFWMSEAFGLEGQEWKAKQDAASQKILGKLFAPKFTAVKSSYQHVGSLL